MGRRTTSAAKSPSARSAAAPAATPVETAATPSSGSAKPAQSSVSYSGITSAHGSQYQTSTISPTCHNSSGTDAPLDERRRFCPYYEFSLQAIEFANDLDGGRCAVEPNPPDFPVKFPVIRDPLA